MTNQATHTIPTTQEPHNRVFGTPRFRLDISHIIGGRKFSTSTATLACVIARTGYSQIADFHYERTGLYLSPRGRWFVAGEGGARSRWGRPAIDGSSRVPGDGIELISEREARQLLERHDGLVEAFFASEEG
jgi:hypothetical protein